MIAEKKLIAALVGLIIFSMIVTSHSVLGKKLPANCDESSDDKVCKDFQIIVNKSHNTLEKFNKEMLPKIIQKIKLKAMGLTSV
jgi:hypothetical protein